MPTLRRTVSATLLAIAALLGITIVPAMGQGSPEDTSITVQPDAVAPGETIEVIGTCGPDAGTDPVPIVLGGGIEGGQLDVVTVDPISGAFATRITISADSPTGTGTLFAGCGLGSDIDPRTTLTVARGAGAQAPIGNLDRAAASGGVVSLAGWTIDPDTIDPIDVHVYVDGEFTTGKPADRKRPDVDAAFPDFGPRHGFGATLDLASGTHRICAYGINVGAPAPNSLLGCRDVTVGGDGDAPSGAPFGNLDRVVLTHGVVEVAGWTIDPDTTDPIDVHVYVDDQFALATPADAKRPDVAVAISDFGPRHGFGATLDLASGTHRICAYGINVGAPVANTELGCRTVTI